LVVTAIGDCGSCSTNSVHDGIEIERRGIPAVAVCTEAFRVGLDLLTQMRGMPDYRYAIVPHPLGVLPEDQLLERAELATPKLVAIALGIDEQAAKDLASSATPDRRMSAVRDSLANIITTLNTDSYRMSIDELNGSRLDLSIRIDEGACTTCLIGEEDLTNMVKEALPRGLGVSHVQINYPK
jgi:Fe-S cluster biogenesis protein NfuA